MRRGQLALRGFAGPAGPPEVLLLHPLRMPSLQLARGGWVAGPVAPVALLCPLLVAHSPMPRSCSHLPTALCPNRASENRPELSERPVASSPVCLRGTSTKLLWKKGISCSLRSVNPVASLIPDSRALVEVLLRSDPHLSCCYTGLLPFFLAPECFL